MHAHEERRDPRHLRVPLERIEVELAHEELDDVFEADGIDVGEGGLALRSAILPDVGARLRCAFASPVDGTSIVADGEVVWAHDSGPHLGEFGVRFDGLDEVSEDALRRIVEEHEDRALTQAEADELGWPSSPGTYAAPSPEDDAHEAEAMYGAPETIALALDGVASDLVADVVHRADDAMLVEQELPFLRLGTGLTTEDGRRGSIEGVELRIEDDTPRLVLTVVFEAGGHAIVSDVDTVPDAQLPFAVTDEGGAAIAAKPARVAITQTTTKSAPAIAETDDVDEPKVVARTRPMTSVARPAIDARIEARHVDVPEREDDPHDAPVIAPAKKREATQTFRIDADDELEAPRAKSALDVALHTLRTRVLPLLVRLVATVRLLAVRAYRVTAPRVAGGVTAVRSRASHMITALRAQQRRSTSRPRAQHVEAERPKRRVQGGRTTGDETTQLADLEGRKRKNRIVLGLAAGTVLIGAIGLLSEETPATETPAPAVGAPSAPAPVEAAPAPVVMPATSPAAPAPAPVSAGGPMAAPTYPTIDDAAAADATTAESVTPAVRSTSFGADSVPNGQVFELDMTTPVEAVEGEETATGFRVRLTHTNSNSRASPIAQQHPRVDRASIMNQGENAELRIDFLAGRKPPYRVEARGRRLRVILGR